MKKTLAILLLAVMCFALMGTSAFADNEDMIPVFASVPEGWEGTCIWAWADDGTGAFDAWPGGEMEAVGEEGWYFCYVPGFITNIIVNANDGSVQTDGIAVEAGKSVWITVADDNSTEFTYDAQTTAEIPEYVEKFVVHAYVPLSWETVNMWAWSAHDGTNAFASWPGESMTSNGDWYDVVVPGWINSFIANANEGSVQTTDLAVESGKESWIVVTSPESAEVFYEEPAAAAAKAAEEASTAEEAPAAETPAAEPAVEKGNGGLIAGIAAAVVVLGGGTAAVVSKKKKK